MKKRIKLTDEDLAVSMWVYIYLKISEYVIGTDSMSDICGWKVKYLRAHKKENYWRNNCLLCSRYYNKISECVCPLSEDETDCGEGSIYESVLRYYKSENHKSRALKACKRIIQVLLEEEVDKSEVENGEERG